MKWKLLLAVAIALAFLGLLIFTEQGREYTTLIGNSVRGGVDTLSNLVGNFIKVGGENFELQLSLDRNAIYGQTFSLSNTNLLASGDIIFLKIDDKIWEVSRRVEIEMVCDGNIVIEKNGKFSIKGKAKNFRIDDFKVDDVKFEVEIFPVEISFGGKSRLLNMTSVSGTLSKKVGNVEFTANLYQDNLRITDFSGTIEISEKTKMGGNASSLEINGNKV
ncbi:MAG: hypothetical protein QXS37_01035 [Candidatus Aenigmatarchaeota archaeon]